MKQNVLVVGHSDADGHLIVEQTRRNLSSIENFKVKTVVDPLITKDHTAWTKLDSIPEIKKANLVFFVDMMFAPKTFVEEADALVTFARKHDDKKFFVMDHHPLPAKRLSEAENLRSIYRPEVFDCAIGPRSGMMVVAALCEGQRADVADIKEPIHDVLALAMRRASAAGGNLGGEKLLALLRADCWDDLEKLGAEGREFHHLPRGRRSANQPPSKVLRSLERTAAKILAGTSARRQPSGTQRRDAMAYDVDVGDERFAVENGARRRVARNVKVDPRDLETIITMMEVAALSLTKVPGATFSRKELVAEAQRLAGDDIEIREDDINIVLAKQGFLKRVGRELCLR